MSYTGIYVLGGEPYCLGETRNSWRGAMQIWNYVAQRYCGLDRFPMSFDRNKGKERDVWQAFKLPEMPDHERIVLLSTLDNAVAYGRDKERLVAAFEKYAAEQGSNNTSIGEQAALIRDASVADDQAIAWLQTSVSEFWGQSWNEEKDDIEWYNLATGDKHFDIMKEADQYASETTG